MITVSCKLKSLASLFNKPLYLVGGNVRNALLCLPLSDIDIASSVLAEDVIKLLEGTEYKVVSEYKRTGTLKIKCGNEDYEYSTFRTDSYTKGHTPDSVLFTEDIKEDAKRRDFTVNAIYYDIIKGQTADPLGGIADLKNRVLRAADNPQKVFSEDGLRLLRMVRFSSELGFAIDRATFEAAKNNAGLLKDISKERITEELKKIILSDAKYPVLTSASYPHFKGIQALNAAGLLQIIYPLFAADEKGTTDKVLNVFRASEPAIRLVSLFYLFISGFSEYNPEKYLALSNSEKRDIYGVSEVFSRIGSGCSDKLYVAKNAAHFEKALMLLKAEKEAGYNNKYNGVNKLYSDMRAEKVPFSISGLNIDGNDIKELGVPEKQISKVLNKLFEICVSSPGFNNKRKLLEIILRDILPIL